MRFESFARLRGARACRLRPRDSGLCRLRASEQAALQGLGGALRFERLQIEFGDRDSIFQVGVVIREKLRTKLLEHKLPKRTRCHPETMTLSQHRFTTRGGRRRDV